MDPNPTDPIQTPSESGLLSAPEMAGAPDTATIADRPASTEVVVAGRPGAPGGSRARWLVGGGVAVAALAGLVLAATLLGARPLPDALKYLPADSAIVIELRPELPGDQRQHFGNFLAHFPGFEDQSTLDAKIDEALDRIVRQGSDGAIDYASQVKPLLAGPMAVAITPGALSSLSSGGTQPSDGILAVATTDGAATCDSVFGSTTTNTTHRDVEIRTVSSDLACAIDGRYLLFGSAAAVATGLDARLDGTGMDGSSRYATARARLDGDQVASVFIDGAAMVDMFRNTVGTAGQDLGTLETTWVIEGVRVIDNALVFDTLASSGSGAPTASGGPTVAPAADSVFAPVLPSDTLGYVEGHGVGATVEQLLTRLRNDPTQAGTLQQLEAGLAAVGGTANLVDWMEEAGIAIVPTDDGVGGALLVRGTDAAAASARLAQIRNLLVLASTGTDITIRDTDHGGVTITSVDLGDLSTLLGDLGMAGSGLDTAPGARFAFEMAVRDDLVIIGVGDGVVGRILDVKADDSLATTATYGAAIDIAGSRNSVQVYVAIDAALGLVERFLPADEMDTWTRDLKPYLDHLAGGAFTLTRSGADARVRGVLTVK